MSIKSIIKTLVVALLVAFTGYQTIGHPAFQNLYALDARARPELRTRCEICHRENGRASDPDFLSEFGRAFRSAGNRITPAIRDRFPDLFRPADEPVEELSGDTIKFETSQVAVNVVVSNARGEFVRGLDREAFTLLEDGREQEIIQIRNDDAPLALAVILDSSGSALSKDLERWRQSIEDLAAELHDQDVLALYTFGEAGIEQTRDFSNTIGDLRPILKNLKGRGSSPLYDAILKAVADLRERPERRRAILLFSDGSESGSSASRRQAEQETFRAGIAIYAIDLINQKKNARSSAERQAAAHVLESLAVETGGRYLPPPPGFSFWGERSKMKGVFRELIDEIHSQYTIVYEPANGRRVGRWRTIRIEMEQSDLKARARLGYREGTP